VARLSDPKVQRVATALAVVASAAVAASLAQGGASHRDPCHLRHECPSDHHTYPWGPQSLYCTSYPDERLASDTTTVAWGGRTYWCHTGTAAGTPSKPTGSACGVERWRVKTLADTTAGLVSPSARRTTIPQLARLLSPAGLASATRQRGTETSLFTVRARLVEFAQEDDSDIHLVVADPASGAKMIVEFPADYCALTTRPPLRAKMRSAREALIRACGPASSSFRTLRGTATITGVGFFDAVHGQRGVASNGIELHPVLAFSGTCT
jgi:hypothetical protein